VTSSAAVGGSVKSQLLPVPQVALSVPIQAVGAAEEVRGNAARAVRRHRAKRVGLDRVFFMAQIKQGDFEESAAARPGKARGGKSG